MLKVPMDPIQILFRWAVRFQDYHPGRQSNFDRPIYYPKPEDARGAQRLEQIRKDRPDFGHTRPR